jgi:hypothetical protein
LILRTAAAFIAFSLFGLVGATVNFDNLKPATFPPFWTATSTGPTQVSRWEIQRDSTAPSRPNVFAQVSGVASNSEFPLAVFDKIICRDGDLSVKFKIAAGARRVKTAGIVWRYQDPRNYYLLNFSVDERNIALFRVQNGQLRPIPVLHGRPGDTGVSHDLRTGQWYVAKVIFRGNSFHVLFGNRELFDAVDDSLPAAGKTGLWTRGGTVASFDDFRIDRKG